MDRNACWSAPCCSSRWNAPSSTSSAQTITRSLKHRLFLATYGGFGAALAVMTLAIGPVRGCCRLPLTLSFVLVSGLRAAFNFPSELRANWAFQISEITGVRRYLAATRKWIVVCAILPLFLLLAPMEFVCFPWRPRSSTWPSASRSPCC